ncbi:type VII secretion-associated serine protease mycosin [Streptomyces sp. SID8352]|uniref:type VII secretion-associated serine protease mycosin n=1 Tax=Streptomyces sp. SID8352 TaxID=2690338 RepID=UPI001371AB25|nr:type VII secretion-associated serine protease mycosin [Streptomyces sp. SID8352]MYU22027.1 type VII secretion-associated serine protease mycosin [Streptomyces sp. SID8352]
MATADAAGPAVPRDRPARRSPRAAVRAPAVVLAATALTATALGWTAPPVRADDGGRCTFPGRDYEGRPWSLQRVNLDELWEQSTGEGVKVAVIDTGVDARHPQLAGAVDASSGRNYLRAKNADGGPDDRGDPRGTTDTVGHGTKVAGIIAARPARGTGFVGLAPGATIIPVKQNDAEGNGTAATLAAAVRYAADVGAGVINISQDTADAVEPEPELKEAVDHALARGAVVVASAGNDGLGGKVGTTYPASYDGVLAVASSDRNNERAPFSQSGEFVGVAAPGVDIVSTVPGGGHCSDNGTSFSAPYVAGVAALLKAKYPRWSPARIVARIERTAERSVPGHDRLVGWGVVDPVRALTDVDPAHPDGSPAPDEQGLLPARAPSVPPVRLGESPEARDARVGTYAVVGGLVLVTALAGTAVATRDARRRDER